MWGSLQNDRAVNWELLCLSRNLDMSWCQHGHQHPGATNERLRPSSVLKTFGTPLQMKLLVGKAR